MQLEVIQPTREQFIHDLPDLAKYLEMPTGSFSVFPLYRLAQACREDGYKVVLSGEGSDEIFAGDAGEPMDAGPGTASIESTGTRS